MTSSFSNLSLAEPLARAVAEMGYETMTPIQEQAIPVVLQGKDVMGAAQTGTGKTAAFALPLLQPLMKHENASTPPAPHPHASVGRLPTRRPAHPVAGPVARAVTLAVLGGARRAAQPCPVRGRPARLRSVYVIARCLINSASVSGQCGVDACHTTEYRLLRDT